MSARAAFGDDPNHRTEVMCIANGCEATAILASRSLPLCERHVFSAYRQIGEYLRTVNGNPEATTEIVVSEFDLLTAVPRTLSDSSESEPAYVYYARFGDRVKIGCARHVPSRLTALPVEEVLTVEIGSFAREAAMHRRFAENRVVGEWFTLSDELSQHIADIRSREHELPERLREYIAQRRSA